MNIIKNISHITRLIQALNRWAKYAEDKIQILDILGSIKIVALSRKRKAVPPLILAVEDHH